MVVEVPSLIVKSSLPSKGVRESGLWMLVTRSIWSVSRAFDSADASVK